MLVNPLSFDYDKAGLLGLAAGMAWALGSEFIRRFPNADFLHITFMQYSVGGLLAGTAAFVMGDVFPETHRLRASELWRCLKASGCWLARRPL